MNLLAFKLRPSAVRPFLVVVSITALQFLTHYRAACELGEISEHHEVSSSHFHEDHHEHDFSESTHADTEADENAAHSDSHGEEQNSCCSDVGFGEYAASSTFNLAEHVLLSDVGLSDLPEVVGSRDEVLITANTIPPQKSTGDPPHISKLKTVVLII